MHACGCPKRIEGLEINPFEDGFVIFLNPSALLVQELCDGKHEAGGIPAIRVIQDLGLFFPGSDRDALKGTLLLLGYGLIESGLRHDIYLNRKKGKDIHMELQDHLFEAYPSRRDAEELNRRCWDRQGPIAGGPQALPMLSPPDLIFPCLPCLEENIPLTGQGPILYP